MDKDLKLSAGFNFFIIRILNAFMFLLAAGTLYRVIILGPMDPLDASEHLKYDPLLTFSACETGAVVHNKSIDVQLSDVQIMWIAGMLHLVHSVNRKQPQLLVFGLGNDSPVWQQINCNGRTVFVEDDADWSQRISSQFPSLEVHYVHYDSSIQHIADFWGDPIDLHVHESVDSVCFDAILIDGPKGYASNQPGRMIPAYYSTQKARRCKSATVVFLHDMQREAEETIGANLFSPEEGWHNLGEIKGEFGTLTGWVFNRMNA